jgi:hypothetical protein
VTFAEAETLCSNIGARLCTLDELLVDEARGTGCNFDTKLIWSSSHCDGHDLSTSGVADNARNAFYLSAGSSVSNAALISGFDGTGDCTNATLSVGYVRCCADMAGCQILNGGSKHYTEDPTQQPTRVPTPVPSHVPFPLPTPKPTTDSCSTSTCSELGWSVGYGSAIVCGESEVWNSSFQLFFSFLVCKRPFEFQINVRLFFFFLGILFF